MAHPEQELIDKIHYVYRHIRLDNNEVFYIGIGKKTEQDLKYGTYHRADSKRDRSQFWYRIVNKTNYIIEIMMDNLTEKECKEKEREFIGIYGRRDLKLGTLCNLTDGGEGFVNLSQNVRDKLREAKLGSKNPNFGGKSMTEETKNKISIATRGSKNSFYGKKYYNSSKIVLNLETGIFYDSIKDASDYVLYKYKCFKAMLNGQNSNKTSFIIC